MEVDRNVKGNMSCDTGDLMPRYRLHQSVEKMHKFTLHA